MGVMFGLGKSRSIQIPGIGERDKGTQSCSHIMGLISYILCTRILYNATSLPNNDRFSIHKSQLRIVVLRCKTELLDTKLTVRQQAIIVTGS